MPFGLKNAGATYQRTATAIMSDMIHREIEVYVDDMIVKSKNGTSIPQYFESFSTGSDNTI